MTPPLVLSVIEGTKNGKNGHSRADAFSETVMVRIRTEMQKKGHPL
jgi:hypothetical protein